MSKWFGLISKGMAQALDPNSEKHFLVQLPFSSAQPSAKGYKLHFYEVFALKYKDENTAIRHCHL